MTRHPVTLVVCLPRVVPDDPNRANPELGAGCGGEGAAVGLARGATCQSMWQLDVELREELATRESRARPGTPNRTGGPARPTRAGRPPRGEPPRRRARRKRRRATR